MVSAACQGERCWCGQPAAKKVGEEILFDDPMPRRHNLTSYICGEHYAQLMGPLGAEQVGYTRTMHSASPTPATWRCVTCKLTVQSECEPKRCEECGCRHFAKCDEVKSPTPASVDVTLQSVRTWVRGLPHDMESREQVLADLDAAILAMPSMTEGVVEAENVKLRELLCELHRFELAAMKRDGRKVAERGKGRELFDAVEAALRINRETTSE